MVGHNTSGFDSSVVLISSVKEKTDLKIMETATWLILLSFRCGAKIVRTVEV